MPLLLTAATNPGTASWEDASTVIPDPGIKLIFEEIVTSTVSSVDTGTLETGYKSLRIEIGLRSDRADTQDTLGMHFNGDTTAANYHYYQHRYGFNHDVASTADTRVAAINGNTAAAGYLAGAVISILDHESANVGKYWVSHSTVGSSTSTINGLHVSGFWESSAAITSISFFSQFGTDLELGYVRVYGVK